MSTLQEIWQIIIESNLWTLVGAALVLVVGWLVAIIVARKTERGLTRLADYCRIREKLAVDEKTPHLMIGIIGKVLYALILFLTIIGVLGMLNLSGMAAPIHRFVEKLTVYGANLIGAGVLALIAFLLATLLRYLTRQVLAGFDLNTKLKLPAASPGAVIPQEKLIAGVSTAVYWLVWLFFIPAILNALQIEGVTAPLIRMFGKVLDFLPNLFTAAVILLVGLWAAKILRRGIAAMLGTIRINTIGEKAGVNRLFGNGGLADMIATVAYVLVALPVVIAALTALQIDSLSQSVNNFFDQLLGATANIFGAALLLFAAFIVGGIVGGLVTQLCAGFGLDSLFAKLGFLPKKASATAENSETPRGASTAAGKLTFVAVMLLASIAACNLLNFDELAVLLHRFCVFGGNLLIAAVVLLIGVWLANLAASMVESASSGSTVVAQIVRIAVLVFTGAIALSNMNIGSQIVLVAFALVLGALCVAFALAFGLGGRDFAARKLEEFGEKIRRKN